MASSQRDVELVIRARDEATKALASITEALNTLAETQTRVGESANTTGSTFDKLGEALAGMKTQLEGFKALDTAVAQLSKAGDAIERLQPQVNASTERLEGSRAQYEAVGNAIETLRGRSAELKESLAAEQAALQQTQVESNALNSVMTKLGESLPRTAAEVKKLTAATESQKQAYRDNRDQMIQHIEQQLRLEATAKQQATAIKELSAQQKQAGAELAANEKVYSNLAAQIERQGNAQQQATTRVAEASGAYSEMATAAEHVASVLGGVELTTEGVAAASRNATETIRQLNAEMAKQQPVHATAASTSATPRQELMAAKDAVQQSEAVWRQASVAVAALNNEIKATAAPTQEQAAKLLLAKEAAIQAKAAYEQNVAALGNVRAKTREFINETNQERIATLEAARAAREMSAARETLEHSNLYASQQQEIGTLQRLKTDWQELTSAIKANFVAQAEAIRAQNEHTASANAASNSIANLKSQVVGLAGAYFGLIGAVQAVKAVIDTYRTLDAAHAQLVAANNGDQKAAAADMSYVRNQAERLGLSLKDLIEQYGKLTVASNSNNVSQKTTRELFTSIAEASRVVGLDSEHTSNVLYGFVRMIDFGKISARDFRSVLTQIPGAQKAMDDALDQTTGKLGVNASEFRKLEKSAEGIAVTDELLAKFAENIHKNFVDKLPYALRTFNAEWGLFQTNLQESQQTVGKSGFIDAIASQLQRLNAFMKSDEGQQYFQNIGHALAGLVNILGALTSHIGILKFAFEAMIAVKVGSFLVGLIPATINLISNFKLLSSAIVAFAEGEVTAAAAATGLGAAMGGLPIIIGAVVLALWEFFGNAVEGVTKLDETFDRHDRTLARVADAYTAAGGKVDEFRKKLKDVNEQTLLSEKQDLRLARPKVEANLFDAAEKAGVGPGRFNALDPDNMGHKISDLITKLKDGKINVEEFRKKLDELKISDDKFAQSHLYRTLNDLSGKLQDTDSKIQENRNELVLLKGNQEDATKAAHELGLGLDALGNLVPTDKLEEFNNSLLALKKNIPELARAAEAQEKLNKAKEQVQVAIGKAQPDPSMIKSAIEAFQGSVGNDPKIKTQVAEFNSAVDKAQGDASRLDAAINAFAVSIDRSHVDSKQVNGAITDFIRALDKAKVAGINTAMDLYHQSIREIAGSAELTNAQEGTPANYLKTARQYVGMNEHRDRGALEELFGAAGAGNRIDPEKLAWCAAFVNAVLAKNGITGTGSALASSFTKFGTEVKPEKAEPGDIVIIKGKDGTAHHVGFFEGLNANGSVRVLGGNQGGAQGHPGSVTEETFGAKSVIGIRRKTPLQSATEAESAVTAQDVFDQRVKDEVIKLGKDAAALAKSARDLAVQAALDALDKEVADSKVRDPAHPLKFTAAQRAEVGAAAGANFDAKQLAEEAKQLEEIRHKWFEIKNAAVEVTAEERAQSALLAKGMLDPKTKQPRNAIEREALTDQTAIETNKDFHQQLQDIIGLSSQLSTAKGALRTAWKDGDSKAIKEDTAEVKRLNAEILKGLPALRAYFTAMHDEKALADLRKIERELHNLNVGLFDQKEINRELAGGLTGTFDAFAKGLAGAITGANNLGTAFKNAGQAFLQFAADFLLKIAEMIIQAEILKLLESVLGIGGGGGGVAGFLNKVVGGGGGGSIVSSASSGFNSAIGGIGQSAASISSAALKHTGGIVGGGGMSRSIDPAVFASAIRMHTGGIAGLAPDEYATILQRNEEVLREDSPRHIKNMSQNLQQAAHKQQDIKIVNALDSGHMISEALGTTQGQRAVVNFIRSNSRAVNSALKG